MEKNIIDNEEKFLTGKLKGYSLKGFENKFNNKGDPLFFPGCTIIYKINLNSELSKEINKIQSEFKLVNPNDAYTYLPVDSFHMTLFDCCNSNTFDTPFWPKNIPIIENYSKIAFELKNRIKNFKFPENLNLKLKSFFGGYCITLEGSTNEDEIIIRKCRDDLSQLLGIKFNNHENYVFHITLAYILRTLTGNEINKLTRFSMKKEHEFQKKFPLITLNDPILCTFENMFEFKKV